MDSLDLARRAVAAEGWRITDGMRLREPRGSSVYYNHLRVLRVVQIDDTPGCWCIADDFADDPTSIDEMDFWPLADIAQFAPCLEDVATLGCVLALVREKHGKHCWVDLDTRSYGDDPDEWTVYRFDGGYASTLIATGDTEIEALVAALEAGRGRG